MGSIEQRFWSANLTLWRCCDEDPITEEQVTELCESLNQSLSKGKWDCIEHVEIVEDEGEWFVYLKLGLYGDSYYDVDCEYEPYHPATMYNRWGDPGDPAEGGIIECYDSTHDMLDDVWGCPIEWDYEIDEEDFETEEQLWDKLGEYNEPDPDRAYEEWRDRQLEEDY